MSIALAGTLCNPLGQTRESQSKWQDPSPGLGKKVWVGASGSGEAGRGKNSDHQRKYPDPHDLNTPYQQGQLDKEGNYGLLCYRVQCTSSPNPLGTEPSLHLPWPLALGSWPRSHFTQHRRADTSGLGSVLQHNSWTAAAVHLVSFKKI